MAIINAITPKISVMSPPVIHDLSGISELSAHMKITPAMKTTAKMIQIIIYENGSCNSTDVFILVPLK